MEIRCPDLQFRALFFALGSSWKDVINIYGKHYYPENYHKCRFSYKLLKKLLNECGINKKNTRRIQRNTIYP